MAAQPDSPPLRRSTSLVVKLLLLLISTAFGVVALEVAVRASWSSQGRPFSQATARAELAKAGSILQEGLDPIPVEERRGSQADDDPADVASDDATQDGSDGPDDGSDAGPGDGRAAGGSGARRGAADEGQAGEGADDGGPDDGDAKRPRGRKGARAARANGSAKDSESSGGSHQGSATGGSRSFLHPYFGWDVEGPHSAYVEQLDSFASRRAAEAFDILILGGSVAANFGWTGKGELLRALSEDPRLAGRPLRLLNHGIAGFKQPQQLNRFAYLLALGYEPDLVINLDGFNELALGNQNATNSIHPLHPSSGHWARLMLDPSEGDGTSGPAFDALAELRYHQLDAEASVDRAVQLGLDRFALTTELAAWWIRRIRQQGLAAYDRLLAVGPQEAEGLPIYGPEFDHGTPEVLELAVQGWASASFALHGICQVRGIDYLHVLQPTLHDPGSKPLTPQEIETSACSPAWRTGAEQGYPMLRAAGAQLAAAGVEFFDASMVFADVTGSLYFDACHFVREGQELLARAIASDYLARLGPDGPERPRAGFHAGYTQR